MSKIFSRYFFGFLRGENKVNSLFPTANLLRAKCFKYHIEFVPKVKRQTCDRNCPSDRKDIVYSYYIYLQSAIKYRPLQNIESEIKYY